MAFTSLCLAQFCELRLGLVEFGIDLDALGRVLDALMVTSELVHFGFEPSNFSMANDARIQILDLRRTQNGL